MYKSNGCACSSISSFLAFFFFAGYTLSKGRYFQLKDDYAETSEYESEMILAYVTTALLLLSSVFYVIYNCGDGGCKGLLTARIIFNFLAMVLYLGASCDFLSADGLDLTKVSLDLSKVEDYSTENYESWGSEVAFSLGWVLLSLVEIKEAGLFQNHWARVVEKIVIFLFWALFTVFGLIRGKDVLDFGHDHDLSDWKVLGGLYLATGVASALGVVCFIAFGFCGPHTWLSVHQAFCIISSILLLSCYGYFYHIWLDALKPFDNDLFSDYYDQQVEETRYNLSQGVFLSMALMAVSGIDNYFWEVDTEEVTIAKVVQIV